jgi:hypothetical protein
LYGFYSHFVRLRVKMPRSKRVRKSVNYAESDLSSLTEPSSQVYDTSRRQSRRARDQLPFSPASHSVVEITPERATSRSSMPPLEPIWPPTLLPAEEENFRAPSPYDFVYQKELEASYLGALLTSKLFLNICLSVHTYECS